MTLDEIVARVDADVAALGPVAAKEAATALVFDLMELGINPWSASGYGTLLGALDTVAETDGSPEQLGCVVVCTIQCALATGWLPELVLQKYVDRMT